VRRALVVCAAASIAAIAAPIAVSGCGTQPPKDPSFLLVELDVPSGLAETPHAVQVKITSTAKGVSPATLCVQLEPPGAAVPASLVLQRDYGADPKPQVTIEVTAFDALAGGSAQNQGKDFPCPTTLPPPIGEPQAVVVDFCATKAQKIVFNVGAQCCSGAPGTPDAGMTSDAGDMLDGGDADGAAPEAGTMPDGGGGGGCGCGPNEVCGAGLGTDGYACPADACCSKSIKDACALEPAG
jgi:hypothetical protein